MLLGGLRREHTFGGAAESIPAQWEAFTQLGTLPGQVGRTAYGAMCAAAPEREWFEYMTAVEVESFDALPPGTGRMRVPAQTYAVFEHRGHVSAIKETWDAIWGDWLPRSGIQPADTPDFERYGERFDPATGSGVIEIWFPVQSVPPGEGITSG